MAKRSIIKSAKSGCFFCGSHKDLERHHCLHGPNRKLAEEDGLVVHLCRLHHIELHFGAEGHKLDETLKKAAQYAWMTTYGKNVEEWRNRYGMNYL